MRRFGLIGFLALLLLVGAVGAVSYNLGVSAGAADAAIAEGASVIYAPGAGISPFALIVGGFFVIMLIGFIAKGFAGPRRGMGPGPWGRGRYGHGSWDDGDVPEPFRPMLERWHKDAHARSSGAGTAPPPGGRAPAGPPPGPGMAPTGPGVTRTGPSTGP